jgi:6,7-dimethyl-8-ribityllumazine synthase
MADATIKGLPAPPKSFDGSNKRILVVHARWNATVIESLVQGCIGKLKAQGVKEENIHVETVPGSYELPFAVQQWVPYGCHSLVGLAS